MYRHVMGQICSPGRKVDYAAFKDGAAGAQASYFARRSSVSWDKQSQYLNHKEYILK